MHFICVIVVFVSVFVPSALCLVPCSESSLSFFSLELNAPRGEDQLTVRVGAEEGREGRRAERGRELE